MKTLETMYARVRDTVRSSTAAAAAVLHAMSARAS